MKRLSSLISLLFCICVLYAQVETRLMCDDEHLYCNICITSSGELTVQSNVELMGNSSVIVETGGKLIIDGGTLSNVDLVMKSGSSLRIVNNGIIETKNGFEAPLGALVDIEHGKILKIMP